MQLTRTLAAGVIAAAALAVPSGAAHAAGPGVPSVPAAAQATTGVAGATRAVPRAAEMQALLDAMVAGGGATSAIARVTHGTATWRGTAGPARLDRPGPAPVDGRFRIGSVTKTFVATVVLQLVAERRLRLEDPVQRWLPGTVPNGRNITLRHLLNHTSGLFNYTDVLVSDPDEFLRNRMRTWTPQQLVAMATAHPPLFEPGARWSYSNTNYVLLGLVVERATGRPYGAEVQRRILRPLGLRDTSVPGRFPLITGPHARAYAPTADGPLDVTRLNPSMAYAAGEMISSTADLNRFTSALLGGRLLPPAQLRQMTRPVPGAGYGLGLQHVVTACGTTVYGHTGGIPNYGTFTFATADGRRQVTVSLAVWTGDPMGQLASLVDAAFCPAGAAAVRARGGAPGLTLLR
ncbi:MAG TPA: serine hydrolase domain-containing protein [Pilimelia sp.]|nr:serine hydrolase domain-containing protein [Pilimelia sp.]